ncbi:MAG: DUF2760 domain-containing protein [Rhodoferax sp.]|nr:DUF2760 domain-containing protein [Rhodoferax sp.]MDP3650859.1 DUF2760 domain-containing protein [Rhodoferax sp.]
MPLSTHTPEFRPPKPPAPSFFSRLAIALRAFFRILADADYAARVDGLRLGAGLEPPHPATPPATVPTPAPAVNYNDAALQLLALLQRDARLIDFTQEDVTRYSDADIGGAARVVHEGCRKVLREHFSIVPVRQEAEGSRIILNDGFDARAIRLTGNVVGKAPFQGSLSHRGWRAIEVRLPTFAESHDVTVLAQAEVEL